MCSKMMFTAQLNQKQHRNIRVTAVKDLLNIAAANDWPDAVCLLLEKANVQAAADPRARPLASLQWIQDAFVTAAWWGSVGTLCVLLRAKATTTADISGPKYHTALTAAASQGHTDVARALLQAKACANVRDGSERMPLASAARRGHTGFVRVLLQAKACADLRDGSERPLLATAVPVSCLCCCRPRPLRTNMTATGARH